ncbi:MAG TPA: hypothetical protein VG871_12620 [Vicinamibacterales bacterium]|nr:hypothetical protein [Vicinamibacterales bacterium]
MAETTRDKHQTPAGPPGGGEQDHEAMRVAAMLPVTPGTASTDALATTGGLNVPGGDPAETTRLASGLVATSARHEPIPGERDPSNLTHREKGARGVPFWGEDTHVDLEQTMDAQTRRERATEGGGGLKGEEP